MSVVGNMQPGLLPQFSSGYAANSQNLYNSQQHPNQQPVPNDRPFKCDQCPQSFNRNHDLKRHKRIHLSVKPFPCNHCDKSFSRKDALKVGRTTVLLATSANVPQRHILVKGCGKRGEESISKEAEAESESGPTRQDSQSDDADDSTVMSEQA